MCRVRKTFLTPPFSITDMNFLPRSFLCPAGYGRLHRRDRQLPGEALRRLAFLLVLHTGLGGHAHDIFCRWESKSIWRHICIQALTLCSYKIKTFRASRQCWIFSVDSRFMIKVRTNVYKWACTIVILTESSKADCSCFILFSRDFNLTCFSFLSQVFSTYVPTECVSAGEELDHAKSRLLTENTGHFWFKSTSRRRQGHHGCSDESWPLMQTLEINDGLNLVTGTCFFSPRNIQDEVLNLILCLIITNATLILAPPIF